MDIAGEQGKYSLIEGMQLNTPLISDLSDTRIPVDGSAYLENSPLEKYVQKSVHCHNLAAPDSGLDKKARCKLLTASALCLCFMVGEIIGGTLANSLAIATDAAHLLSDFASFMISLLALYLANRPATQQLNFGWHRAEVLGALVSVLMIWFVTIVLVFMAAHRIHSNEYDIDATVMLVTSAVGVAINLVLGITLHDGHGHGHGHSHGSASSHSHVGDSCTQNNAGYYGTIHSETNQDYDAVNISLEDVDVTDEENEELLNDEKSLCKKSDDLFKAKSNQNSENTDDSKKPTNINVRAAFIHVVGDFVQSIGVFVAALIIYFKPEWKIADPICTFVFSVLVIATTISIIRDTVTVLMEGRPRSLSYSDVQDTLNSIQGVKGVHNQRVWSLTISKAAISVHLAIDKSADHQRVQTEAGYLLRKKYGVHDVTIQTETYVDSMQECTRCHDLA